MKPCKTCTRKLLDKKSPEYGRKAQKKTPTVARRSFLNRIVKILKPLMRVVH